jgi:hypothetical protein
LPDFLWASRHRPASQETYFDNNNVNEDAAQFAAAQAGVALQHAQITMTRNPGHQDSDNILLSYSGQVASCNKS